METSGLTGRLLELYRKEYPGFRIVNKEDSLLMRILGFFLGKEWMEHVSITTLRTIYIPKKTRERKTLAGIIAHEICHYAERKEIGTWRYFWRYTYPEIVPIVINIPLMLLALFFDHWYLALPMLLVLTVIQLLPTGVAFYRAEIEARGYAIGKLVQAMQTNTPIRDKDIESVAKSMSGATYFWMVSKKAANVFVWSQLLCILVYMSGRSVAGDQTMPNWYYLFCKKTIRTVLLWRKEQDAKEAASVQCEQHQSIEGTGSST